MSLNKPTILKKIIDNLEEETIELLLEVYQAKIYLETPEGRVHMLHAKILVAKINKALEGIHDVPEK